MPRFPTIVVLVCGFVLGASPVPAADAPRPEAPDSERPPAAPAGLVPIVVGTPETLPPGAAKPPPKPAAPRPPEPSPAVRADAAAHVVRFPVTMVRPDGPVDRLVSCELKYAGRSVFTTPCSARDLAKAFDRAGFPAGRPPARAADDHMRPPSGPTVEIALVVRARDGRETRFPAATFLSEEPRGTPLAEGRWVWVGPQVIRDGDAAILMPALSGSVVTTDLGDSSAMAYWVAAGEKAEVYGLNCYASSSPRPPQDCTLEIEVRLVPDAKPSAAPKPEGPAAPAEKTPG